MMNTSQSDSEYNTHEVSMPSRTPMSIPNAALSYKETLMRNVHSSSTPDTRFSINKMRAITTATIARSSQGLFAGAGEAVVLVVVVGVGRGTGLTGAVDVVVAAAAGAEPGAAVVGDEVDVFSPVPDASASSPELRPSSPPVASFLPSNRPIGSNSSNSSSTSTLTSLQASQTPLIISKFDFPPSHSRQTHPRESLAYSRLTLTLPSIPPTCPLLSPPIISLRIASSAVRTPHAGCHVSSWWPEILRQISRLTSKRPEGVRKRKLGGRSGYVGGKVMRPW